jgi:hypothetical protein
MKTFTLQYLRRRVSAVLEVCDREGAVRIRRPNGRQYILGPEAGMPGKVPWRKAFAEHRARRKRIFPKPIPQEQIRAPDQPIGGGWESLEGPSPGQ